ncbi:MAG: anion permease [Thermoleophilia bacterium]|jgi:PiT family inorganic phosphate transporter
MTLLIVIVAVALVFDFTNGFHDTANAIATSVSTRALPPRVAVLMAAGMNMLGAFLGKQVATTLGQGIVATVHASQTLLLAALIGAIGWNLVTWYFGLPSSSSHALVGGLVGAAIAAAGSGAVMWAHVWDKVVLPMILSPAIGLVLAFLLMTLLLWMVARARASLVNRWFRHLQPLSAAAMALAHGMNDAQKTMGLITLALLTSGHIPAFQIPVWVIVAAATSMALGTLSGGWRIIHTLGSKVMKLDPIHGFAAETSAAAVIFVAASLGFPISTTHTITAAIMGTGATQRLSAVRWGVAGNILTAWILTLPMAALFGAGAYELIHLFA